MFLLKKPINKILRLLVILLSLQLIVVFVTGTNQENNPYAFVEFEDNTESTEDHKHENKVKEDKLDKLNVISLQRLYLSDCSEYGQLAISHSLEVYLEIVTPPPEA